jgi:hypothetical protein
MYSKNYVFFIQVWTAIIFVHKFVSFWNVKMSIIVLSEIHDLYSSITSSVFEFFVTSCTRLPFFGRSSPLVHFMKSLKMGKDNEQRSKITRTSTYSATNCNGVQVEKSASAIHFRFIGVSNVIGNIETTNEFAGKPELEPANDFVRWCTAALAIP